MWYAGDRKEVDDSKIKNKMSEKCKTNSNKNYVQKINKKRDVIYLFFQFKTKK